MVRRKMGPISYDRYRQRVRRFRRTDVIVAVASMNSHLKRAEAGQESLLQLPNYVTPFALGGVARTALVSGSEHRNLTMQPQDLFDLCALYTNVDEPALRVVSGPNQVRSLLNHMAYEQFPHQFSEMENVGRTLLLLSYHHSAGQGAPTDDDWVNTLGVSLEQFIRLGFAMHVAAIQNNGVIDREVLKKDHVAVIFAPLGADQALEVIDRLFASTLEELRAVGARHEEPGEEKWSMSPLVEKPVVALSDGRFVVPWPWLVLDRVTPTGLYYIGLDAFGRSFPDALGVMFQEYVGSQLRLLQNAEIKEEIVYGKSSSRTVDFFIVTPQVVVLVEVKAARPVWATRFGRPRGDEDTNNKVGHAIKQIGRTARLIQDGQRELANIPSDRPLRGLVVTLEPFLLVNSIFYDDVMDDASIPTTVASSHDLEGTVASLRTVSDPGARLLDALTPKMGASATNLRDAGKGLPNDPNPLLADAWQRFSEPWYRQRDGEATDPTSAP